MDLDGGDLYDEVLGVLDWAGVILLQDGLEAVKTDLGDLCDKLLEALGQIGVFGCA